MSVMLLTKLKDDFILISIACLFFSETLGKKIKLKVSSRGIKTVEKNGGIDNYIVNTKNSDLTEETRKLKKLIVLKSEKK